MYLKVQTKHTKINFKTIIITFTLYNMFKMLTVKSINGKIQKSNSIN